MSTNDARRVKITVMQYVAPDDQSLSPLATRDSNAIKGKNTCFSSYRTEALF